ncbi:MAG: hypothetical protein Q9171_002638 [Xanthocarpia ochracea]
MPLVSSSLATPTSKEKGTQFPENAGSSWSRHWIAQHPPKPSRAEITVQFPSLVGAEEKYPPHSTIEHVSPLHQILPSYPLPIIAEFPQQELRLEIKPEAPALPSQAFREAKMPTVQVPRRAFESGNSDSTDESKGTMRETGGIPQASNILPLSPIVEATGVPLPSSPASDDPPGGLSSTNGQHSPRSQGPDLGASTAEVVESASGPSGDGNDTWISRLNSLMPNAIIDGSSRQSTDHSDTRASRSPSIAPGAYPESDTTEEYLKQNKDQQVEHIHPRIDPPQLDEKSVRSRKSVSIVLPGTSDEIKIGQENRKESMIPSEEQSEKVSPSKSQDEIDSEALRKQDFEENASDRNRYQPEADKDPKPPVGPAGADVSTELLQAPTQREASIGSRTSSIALSQNDTDRSDLSILHERESLAPSEADNSSLMPLLSSSPGDARSGHFSESLEENNVNPMAKRAPEEAESQEKAANTPPVADDSPSLSKVDSPTSSKLEKVHKKGPLDGPFLPADNTEGSSNAESSLPPPKIVVRDASSAEDSIQTPSLVAPATTPVRDSSTLPRRQTTFIALGEPLDHERPVKLPMKSRKLFIRKARYAILRQPILNAALGCQVGPQAKQALKKLAHGELIVVEPPRSL